MKPLNKASRITVAGLRDAFRDAVRKRRAAELANADFVALAARYHHENQVGDGMQVDLWGDGEVKAIKDCAAYKGGNQ